MVPSTCQITFQINTKTKMEHALLKQVYMDHRKIVTSGKTKLAKYQNMWRGYSQSSSIFYRLTSELYNIILCCILPFSTKS